MKRLLDILTAQGEFSLAQWAKGTAITAGLIIIAILCNS